MVLHRTPYFASSTATDLVSALTPAFAAAYAAPPAFARSPAREEMLTIEPPPRRRMYGSASRMHHIGAVRSTRRMASHDAVVMSAIGASTASPPAALLTRTERPSRSSTVPSIN